MKVLCQMLLISIFFSPMVFSDNNWLQETQVLNMNIKKDILSSSRFDDLKREANSLYLEWEYLLAKEKLDNYIEKVFFPDDCTVMDLYNWIFSKLSQENARVQYEKYWEICQRIASNDEIKSFYTTINDKDLYTDKNIYLWKSYLIAEYTGELKQSKVYSYWDNNIFVELVHSAKNKNNGYKLPAEYKKIILESNHYLKPTFLILYIENLKIFSKTINTKDLVDDIFNYEDTYLIGFKSHNSSYEYAYRYLWVQESDLEKKLPYVLNSLKYAIKYEDKWKKLHKEIILEREDSLSSIIFELIEQWEGKNVQNYSTDIKKYSTIDWIHFIELYTSSEWDIPKIEAIFSFYEGSNRIFSKTNTHAVNILKNYFQNISFPDQSTCEKIKKMANDTWLQNIVSCIKEPDNIIEPEVNNIWDNGAGVAEWDNTSPKDRNKKLWLFHFFDRNTIVIILSISTFLLILLFILYIFNRR